MRFVFPQKCVFVSHPEKAGRLGFVCRSVFSRFLRENFTTECRRRWKHLMEHKIAINTRFSAWLEKRQKADWFIEMPVYCFGISWQLIQSVKCYNCRCSETARCVSISILKCKSAWLLKSTVQVHSQYASLGRHGNLTKNTWKRFLLKSENSQRHLKTVSTHVWHCKRRWKLTGCE